MNVRHVLLVLVSLACALALSGCDDIKLDIRVEVEEHFVLHRDLSGTYTQQLVFICDKPLTKSEIRDAKREFSAERHHLPRGVTAELVVGGNRWGMRETLRFHDLKRLRKQLKGITEFFDPSSPVCDLACTKRWWRLACIGKLPKSRHDLPYTLKITMPGKIRRSNADKVEGRTAIWKSAKKTRIEVVSWRLPPAWEFAIAGLGIAAVAAGSAIWVRRRQHSVSPAQVAGSAGDGEKETREVDDL